MPLQLIYGPPNAGKRGVIRREFAATLEREPVLVLPNADDVFSFERELSAGGAVLGGSAMTFGALFRTVATAAGSPPPGGAARAPRPRGGGAGGRPAPRPR